MSATVDLIHHIVLELSLFFLSLKLSTCKSGLIQTFKILSRRSGYWKRGYAVVEAGSLLPIVSLCLIQDLFERIPLSKSHGAQEKAVLEAKAVGTPAMGTWLVAWIIVLKEIIFLVLVSQVLVEKLILVAR